MTESENFVCKFSQNAAGKYIIDPPKKQSDLNYVPPVPWCPCYPYGPCPAEGFPDNQSEKWGKCYCEARDLICQSRQMAHGYKIRPPNIPLSLLN